jgi:hypothetical protein
VHFSNGQIAFTIFFIVVFIGVLIWAYRKDMPVTARYFKGVAPKLILTIVAVYSLIFLIIKLIR